LQRTLTRRQFLKATGAGAAGATLLGASALASGCIPQFNGNTDDINVVLVIVDSLRKDHVGTYGNDWIQTPNLDALCPRSARGVRSTRASGLGLSGIGVYTRAQTSHSGAGSRFPRARRTSPKS
jgi:hypothetical protein